MKRYRLKKTSIIMVSVSVILILIGALILIDDSFENKSLKDDDKDYNYVNGTILGNDVPVVAEDNTLGRPYLNGEVKVIKNYYDRNSTEEIQENSIIYYESTYIQNSAVAYGGLESFDVAAIYDGTVTSVREDELLGYIVEIEHKNNIISVYQSVSEVIVKENQIVKKGEIIAKSGNSNLNKSLNSHLLFELIIDGKIVNPELYYNKNVDEI